MPTIPTWKGRSQFTYEGSVEEGTAIYFGQGRMTRVSASQYAALLQYFRNRDGISVGTSRNPPANTLGVWLNANVDRRAIASYVAPILIWEGYAERVGEHDIRILL